MSFSILFALNIASAQNADDAFKKPLKDVIAEIESRFSVKIRYPEDLVKDRWVTYAGWRFRNYDLDKTLANIFSSQDISYSRTGDSSYKLQAFQYHLKTVEEGKAQLNYLAGLYSNEDSWEKRKGELRSCIMQKLGLASLPKPASKPILGPVRKLSGYTVQNVAIETLPGLYVCGSLYLPQKPKSKLPIVLNPDGHFADGRYRPDCQYRCAMQAKMGVSVIVAE